ncbi:MAG: FAD-dependent oxidoreductase, partial [Acidimicrobiia bacterium]
MQDLEHVAVVGASLAGLRACESLRTEGFTGTVTLVGAEAHLPYDRPPLSKKLLSGDWEPDRIRLRKPEGFDELRLDLRLG